MFARKETEPKRIMKGIENFIVDFHKSVAAGMVAENLVCSAFSAHAVLAMIAYGAEGRTKDEMQKSLHLPKDDESALQEIQTLVDTLNAVEGVVLKVAYKIFTSIKIKDKFKKCTATYFRSECKTLDFSKSEESAKVINNWCADQTNGKITNIIDAGTLGASQMLLLNAVYFKGNWKIQFDKSRTKMLPFHVNESSTIQVPMMYQREYLFYKELKDLKADVVGLPYENEDFYMIIIVPKQIDGLEKLEEKLEKLDLDFDIIKKRRTEIYFTLPKFKVEKSITLNSHLAELGMTEMFLGSANFSAISNVPLNVDVVLQKAFIEVNEEGSEAAAVTMVALQLCSKSRKSFPIPKIVADRPFVYKIVYKNCTLFSGHIVNPLES